MGFFPGRPFVFPWTCQRRRSLKQIVPALPYAGGPFSSMKYYFSCLSAVLLCFAVTAHGELIPRKPGGDPLIPAAPGAPLSKEEMGKLKTQVELLEKELEKKRGGMHASQIAILKEAMSGNEKAFNFWLDCKKEQDFDMKGRTATEFSEWKRTQIKTSGTNDAFCAALRLQIHFLMLAVLHSHAETPAQVADVAAGAVAYVDFLTGFCEKEENLAKSIMNSIMKTGADPDEAVTAENLQETLAKVREAASALGSDVLDSIFARHLRLDGSVKSRPDAAANAGNIDQIYDRLILAPLIEKKDAAGLAAAWNRRIEQTTRVAKATRVDEIEAEYAQVKVPAMKFAMYRDQWNAGQQKPAAAGMMSLISAHPTHKDSNDWLEDLKSLTAGEE